ncbi:hypothetical protein Scep_030478 [Stephania cephalantha]|uniref:Uncharacterized protein n=1 Tax=Stephania cephalantha TaxID=152367 RepID=A0AAP0E367_9MAGN
MHAFFQFYRCMFYFEDTIDILESTYLLFFRVASAHAESIDPVWIASSSYGTLYFR